MFSSVFQLSPGMAWRVDQTGVRDTGRDTGTIAQVTKDEGQKRMKALTESD